MGEFSNIFFVERCLSIFTIKIYLVRIIAVMFTFSFSTAFAATEFSEKYSATIGDAYFESLWETFVTEQYSMTYAGGTWALDSEVEAGLKAEAKAAYDYYMTNVATDYIEVVYDSTGHGLGLLDAFNWRNAAAGNTYQEAFKTAAAKAQFEADKAEALAALATVPTYNYSTAVMSDDDALKAQNETLVGGVAKVTFVDKDYTYQTAAEKLVEYYEGVVEACDDNFNADVTIADYKVAAGKATAVVTDELYPMAYATYASGVVDAIAFTDAYDLKIAYDAAKLPVYNAKKFIDIAESTNLWSPSVIDALTQTTAANVAAVKANNAALYAKYIAENPTAAAKTYADKWLKVVNILAEEGKTVDQIVAPGGGAYEARADYMAKLEAYAARYGAELNADGELVRDAAVVQKYLAEGIVKLATCAAADVDSTYTTYEQKIYGAQSEALAERLQYVKDSVNKYVELKLADLADDYYAAEFAKVEAAAAKCTAAVETATTETAVTTAYNNFVEAIKPAKIKTADDLDDDTSAAETTLTDAAMAYVNYYNTANVAGTNQDNYLEYSTLADRINTLIGESGYRTQAEIKTLKEQAVAIAQALPTKAEVKAAEKAIKDAVAAIPAKATIADVAVLQAVVDAVDAYEELSAANHSVAMTKFQTALTQIDTAYRTQFAKSYSTVDKKDAAAVAALIAEIEAAVETVEDLGGTATYMEGLVTALTSNLDTIKKNDAAAVAKLIKALPINITAADKEAVIAAREAYDAYVAKYTDITTLYDGTFNTADKSLKDGYAANDIEIAVLTSAETVLGLNVDENAKIIASVEGLKIKANSSAKKGSITVKWTVTGDDSNVEKYQVYKSTKAQKGYKKAITTTKTSFKNTKNLEKGTRYYYKVRAYVTVDGVKYYSDWSNKANRIAK